VSFLCLDSRGSISITSGTKALASVPFFTCHSGECRNLLVQGKD
jgi:hypothetical protein